MALAGDDEVVVDREVQGPGGLHQSPGEVLVGGGRGEAAAGVVVHQDEAAGLVFQGQFQDLAGIDHRLVDGALLDDLFRGDFVLAVEEDHPELLIGQAPHGGAAIIHQGRQGGDHRPFEDGLLQIVFGAGLHQPDKGGGVIPQPGDLH